jgi:tetratricopeptide (TPR) repeat protein
MKHLFFVFLLFICFDNFSLSQDKETTKVLEWAEMNIEKNPKNTIDSLETLVQLKNIEKAHLDQTFILDKLAFFYFFDLSNFDLALEKVQEIKKIYDLTKNLKIQILYYENLGMLYYESKTDVKKAFEHFKKAYQISKNEKTNFHAQYILNNYGVALMNEGKFDEALEKLKQGLDYAEIAKDFSQESAILNNIGVYYIIQADKKNAEIFLKKSYEVALKTRTKEDDANRASYLGTFYMNIGKLDQAIYFLNEAKQHVKSLKAFGNKAFVFKSLSETYEKKNQLDEALSYHKTYVRYKDSINFSNISKQLVSIEFQSKINEIEKQNELDRARIENERYTEKLWYLISLLVVLSIGGVAWGIVVRLKQRNKIAELDRMRIQLEKQELALNIEINEREIAAKSLFLLEKDNLIAKVHKLLRTAKSKLKPSDAEIIQDVIHELNYSINNKSWEEFEFRFTKVHPDFYTKLEKSFPNLSNNENKLAAFLFMNLSTKEISTITGQTVHSINVARTRLRKKLNIVNENITFHDFFTKITAIDI